MLRSIRLPFVFLFALPIFINLSFSSREKVVTDKVAIRKVILNDSSASSASLLKEETEKDKPEDLYTLIGLDKKGLSKDAFDLALKGYNKLLKKRLVRNKNIITVVDFSKRSNQKRLYVIDIKKKQVTGTFAGSTWP